MLRILAVVAVAFGIASAANDCGRTFVTPNLTGTSSNALLALLGGKAANIVGGVESAPHSWPWQVLMLADGGLCGGTIIDDDWVLTAGHCCVDDNDATIRTAAITITAGEHNRRATGEPNAKTYRISRVVRHPLYHIYRHDQDFCLLKTTEKIAFNNHVQKVCLGDASDVVVGRKCHISGWGTTFSSPWASASPVLRNADVDIADHAACDAKYRTVQSYISEDMLCATAPGKDTCQGDSGGPLVCVETDGSYSLVGVTSWGYACNVAGFPGVYGDVSLALDFISSTINRDACARPKAQCPVSKY